MDLDPLDFTHMTTAKKLKALKPIEQVFGSKLIGSKRPPCELIVRRPAGFMPRPGNIKDIDNALIPINDIIIPLINYRDIDNNNFTRSRTHFPLYSTANPHKDSFNNTLSGGMYMDENPDEKYTACKTSKKASKKASKRKTSKKASKKASKRKTSKKASKKTSKRKTSKKASKKASKRKTSKKASKKTSKRKTSKSQ